MEEKQQRVEVYEPMQVCSTRLLNGVPTDSSSEIRPCVMCVARRIPLNERPIAPIQQFTVKLYTSGKIIEVDPSGLPASYVKYLNKVNYHLKISDFKPFSDL